MIAEIIVIAVMLLCIFIGYKRGLMKVAVGLIGFIVSLILALILYVPISDYVIENTDIVPNLKTTISSKVYEEEEKRANNAEGQNSFYDVIKNYIDEHAEELEKVEENAIDVISEQIAIAIVRVLVWIALFVGVKLLTLVLRLFSEAIGNIPLIKQFNKAGGAIYGALQGLAIIYIVLGVISLASPMIGENSINKAIEDSHICKFMYENNVILNIIL